MSESQSYQKNPELRIGSQGQEIRDNVIDITGVLKDRKLLRREQEKAAAGFVQKVMNGRIRNRSAKNQESDDNHSSTPGETNIVMDLHSARATLGELYITLQGARAELVPFKQPGDVELINTERFVLAAELLANYAEFKLLNPPGDVDRFAVKLLHEPLYDLDESQATYIRVDVLSKYYETKTAFSSDTESSRMYYFIENPSPVWDLRGGEFANDVNKSISDLLSSLGYKDDNQQGILIKSIRASLMDLHRIPEPAKKPRNAQPNEFDSNVEYAWTSLIRHDSSLWHPNLTLIT